MLLLNPIILNLRHVKPDNLERLVEAFFVHVNIHHGFGLFQKRASITEHQHLSIYRLQQLLIVLSAEQLHEIGEDPLLLFVVCVQSRLNLLK